MGISHDFLLYGSYGFTGNLIAERAVERGLRPLLSGRNAERLSAQADRLGLGWRAFELEDSLVLDQTLQKVNIVIHCAGPYRHTYQPMVEACLRQHVHYVDFTGELLVFEALAAKSEAACTAGILLLPGAGFDVVPTDCLAAHLKRWLPSATRLDLAVQALGGGVSRGTALSAVESLPRQGLVVESGFLSPIPLGGNSREVDFGNGARKVFAVPIADIFTAHYSTGIANIKAYFALPPLIGSFLPLVGRFFGWRAGTMPLKWLLKKVIQHLPLQPLLGEHTQVHSRLWAQASDEHGGIATVRMETPDPYRLTAMTALGVVEKILSGEAPAGFQTPSTAFGADFILEFEGVKRENLSSHGLCYNSPANERDLLPSK